MKTFRQETIVTFNSGETTSFRGHLSGDQLYEAYKKRYPEGRASPGYEVGSMPFSGRAAWLEFDGYDSIKNFSFNEKNHEFDVWEA